MKTDSKLPLIIFLGPTAVGKTSVSIALAQCLDGEIVSADSRLLYRGMNVGTAKPTIQEMSGVPHHLVDVAQPDEVWSLALYQQEAYHAIDHIHSIGRLPFLVGGTGQYIRSILEGWRIPPQSPDYALRDAIAHWADIIGSEALYECLKDLDPAAASKIDYRNLRRTVRALEVIIKTGERFSEQRQKGSCRYAPLVIGINRPREELYERVDQRIAVMLEAGLIDEVRGLLDAGYSPDLPTMSAIGYSEIIQYLQSEVNLDEAITLIKRNTRVFVRRQANWFKPDDPCIDWFQPSQTIISDIEAHIRRYLNGI